MKTKTLILTALLAVAGAATSSAQVYSQNTVGYVNVSLTNGFNLVGNPLVNGTNGISQVIPTAPEGSLLYKLKSNGTFNIDLYSQGTWYDSETEQVSSTTIAPGEGFFLYTTVSTNVTFVGEVKTGTNTVPLNTGFSLVASVVPQDYQLRSPDFPESSGLVHYALVGSGYQVSNFDSSVGWYDAETEQPRQVSAQVGKGFFIFNNGSPVSWTRSFSVNN